VKPRVVKMPKPKAWEPNKREMSLDEKNILKVGLESLPEEKMHNVLQIVRKRSVNNPGQVGDEIEFDIEEMDIETQWELDRLVSNFKKVLNKSRRTAMLNGDTAEVSDTAGAEAVNGAVSTLVDNADMVMAVYCSCLQLVDICKLDSHVCCSAFFIYRRARILRRRLYWLSRWMST
jgi:hypothetical protein